MAELIQAQAAALELVEPEPQWSVDLDARVAKLNEDILELEYTLIPHGLHVVGEAPTEEERVDLLMAIAESTKDIRPERAALEALIEGKSAEKSLKAGKMKTSDELVTLFRELAEIDRLLVQDTEIPAILRALDGRFIPSGTGRRPVAHPGDSADGAQSARLRSLPAAEHLCGQGRRPTGRASDRAARLGRQRIP